MEEGIGVTADAQRRTVRGGGLLPCRIIHQAPSPFRIDLREPGGDAVGADAHQLVDRRHLLAAGEKADLAGTGFECFRCVIDGGCADADDDDALALEGGEINLVGRMRPAFAALHALDETGDFSGTEAITTGCHDELAGKDRLLSAAGDFKLQKPVFTRDDAGDVDAVFDRNGEDVAVPVEVIHPHWAGDPVQFFPLGDAEKRRIPGAESQ
ncbi:hypothetical protein D3C87_1514930 [compost metagenome]